MSEADSDLQQNTPYKRLGGDAGVRRLVDRFYDLMDEDPAVRPLREMHAKSLRGSREKLYKFLSGWLGGPDLYIQQYGHPRLRARHLPFSIGAEERDQWMRCMNRALQEQVDDVLLCEQLKGSFYQVADFMRNKED
ncbi:group II truncated hemoglobin [Granulosicoccaceae sp. 1_MG-2023]|nr:group II truncated hemoglobin [Granulosicoccaceae sp. 1_MG-2023]